MKRIHMVLISMSVWLSVLALFIIIIPANSQSNLPRKLEYSAPASDYIIEKSFSDTVLNDSKEITIPFQIPTGSPDNYNCTVLFTWWITMKSDQTPQRVVIINYTFSSNEQQFDWIREDFVGLSGSLGGNYEPVIINSQTLQTGNNTLNMKVLFAAHAEKTANCYFHLKISDLRINIESLDRDVDGILDLIDPLVGFNNYIWTPIFGIFALPVAILVTRRLPKKH